MAALSGAVRYLRRSAPAAAVSLPLGAACAAGIVRHTLFLTVRIPVSMLSGQLALTLNDFDFDKNTVSITKNYARVNNQDIIQTPKTPKSKRTITLPAEIMEMVKEYGGMLYDYKPTDRLFPTQKSFLTREMVRGCKLSGVKKIRIHDLRHSHASLLIELGFAPLLISERLGHENVETTLNTYSHLYPNKHGEVAEILSNLMRN